MRSILVVLATAVLTVFSAGTAMAHFGMVIPSDDIVEKGEPRELGLNVMFIHPFEGHYMEMAKPAAFGVLSQGSKKDLTDTLTAKKVNGLTTWQAKYSITRPGDYIFYVEPAPYWEPAEDCYIVHYTKVVVGTFGLEDSWDGEVGLKTEIVPLTRPYGLWAGNVFQGVVKVDGKPVPFADVEIEYYNEGGKIKPPADPYITQVTKADQNGVFTYAMPRAGWWGFAALSTDDKKIAHEGKEFPVEIGAVIWVKTRDMK
jgi:cobalt/nickel transport protein